MPGTGNLSHAVPLACGVPRPLALAVPRVRSALQRVQRVACRDRVSRLATCERAVLVTTGFAKVIPNTRSLPVPEKFVQKETKCPVCKGRSACSLFSATVEGLLQKARLLQLTTRRQLSTDLPNSRSMWPLLRTLYNVRLPRRCSPLARVVPQRESQVFQC